MNNSILYPMSVRGKCCEVCEYYIDFDGMSGSCNQNDDHRTVEFHNTCKEWKISQYGMPYKE